MNTEVAAQEHSLIILQGINCESSKKKKYMRERKKQTKSYVQEKEKWRKGL